MILTRQLDRIELDRLVTVASERIGKAADPTTIGVCSPGEYSSLHEKTESAGKSYEIIGLANTAAVDNEAEVVLPGGADWRLFGPDSPKKYKCLYMHHDLKPSSVVATIRTLRRSTVPDGWFIRAKMMDPSFSDAARQAKMLAEEGVLGFSVHFLTNDKGPLTPEEKRLYPKAKSIVRKWIPFEISVSPMQVNVECGATALWMQSPKALSLPRVAGMVPEWVAKAAKPPKPIRRVIVCGV